MCPFNFFHWRDYETKDQGEVTVTAWINDERVSLENLQAQQVRTLF